MGSNRARAGVAGLVNRALGNETPRRLAVILVDITRSIGSTVWTLYQRSFDALAASNLSGDRIVVAAIGDQPDSKFIAYPDRTIIPVIH